jgi:hypothetical protein
MSAPWRSSPNSTPTPSPAPFAELRAAGDIESAEAERDIARADREQADDAATSAITRMWTSSNAS